MARKAAETGNVSEWMTEQRKMGIVKKQNLFRATKNKK